MKQYLDVLDRILVRGAVSHILPKGFTRSLFVVQMTFSMKDGFPIVTTDHWDFRNSRDAVLNRFRQDPQFRWKLDSAVDIIKTGASVEVPNEGGTLHFRPIKDGLSLHFIQLRKDILLAAPSDIMFTALLLYVVAHVARLKPVDLAVTFTDAYIHHAYLDIVYEQLERKPLSLPQLKAFSPLRKEFKDFIPDDFVLSKYASHPAIKKPAV